MNPNNTDTPWEYAEIGDVLIFPGRWANPGHAVIMLCQLIFNRGDTYGRWRHVHAEIVIPQTGQLCACGFRLSWPRLWGWLPLPRGEMVVTSIERRFKEYPGIILYKLNKEARGRLSTNWLMQWLKRRRGHGYNWRGLIFAILPNSQGWTIPGHRFCSEGVVEALTWADVLSPKQNVIVRINGKVQRVKEDRLPHKYSPCEVAGLGIYNGARR